MRCTQIIGLPDGVMEFLNKNCIKVPGMICPNCEEPVTEVFKKEVYDDASGYGMFEDGPKLHVYYLQDGRKVFVEIQAVLWSSGPCIFLRLVEEGGDILFDWTEEQMEEMI